MHNMIYKEDIDAIFEDMPTTREKHFEWEADFIETLGNEIAEFLDGYFGPSFHGIVPK